MQKSMRRMFYVLIAFAISCPPAFAGVPDLIDFQGSLVDNDGVPVTGTPTIQFALYSANTGGAAIWSETKVVMLQDGVYSTQLGDLTTLTDDIWENAQLWLGIKVDADEEMTPRVRIVAVPYAMRAKVAETVVDAVGAQGPQGKQGPDGAQGPQGKSGDPGAGGAEGAQGAQGPQGKQGPDGAQGPQGKAGADGATGAMGPAAAQGPQGKAGADGAGGAAGAQGPQGKAGAAGADGADGAVGAQGPQGKAGADGAGGAQGPQGKQGAAGTDGAAGRGTVVFGRMGIEELSYTSLSNPHATSGEWDPGRNAGGSVIPRDGEILNLFLRPGQNMDEGAETPAGCPATLTVLINGVDTALSVTHTNADGIDPVGNTSTVVAVQQGDIVNLKGSKCGGGAFFYAWSLEIK